MPTATTPAMDDNGRPAPKSARGKTPPDAQARHAPRPRGNLVTPHLHSGQRTPPVASRRYAWTGELVVEWTPRSMMAIMDGADAAKCILILATFHARVEAHPNTTPTRSTCSSSRGCYSCWLAGTTWTTSTALSTPSTRTAPSTPSPSRRQADMSFRESTYTSDMTGWSSAPPRAEWPSYATP